MSTDGASRLDEGLASLEEENAQLRTALQSRIVIEQAKGVLAERFRLDLAEAFFLLRRAARSQRINIHSLAAEVIASRATPPEIERVKGLLAERDGGPPPS